MATTYYGNYGNHGKNTQVPRPYFLVVSGLVLLDEGMLSNVKPRLRLSELPWLPITIH